MNIAITGKDSFIGRNIIENLPYFNFTEIEMKGINIEKQDFSSFSIIIHLAAIVHQKKSIEENIYYKVNRDLAYQTALYAKKQGVKHFIFFSSIKVYGDGGYENVIFNEKSLCKPVDAYGKSKLEAEQLIFKLSDNNFKVSVIRPAMVYGKGVKANMYLLSKIVEKLPVLPFGNINNKRSMVSVDNLIITLRAILENPKTEIYLASDLNSVSTTELVICLNKLINSNKRIINIPTFIINILKFLFPYKSRRLFGSFQIDANKTHKQLNIADKLVPLEVGLRKMLNN